MQMSAEEGGEHDLLTESAFGDSITVHMMTNSSLHLGSEQSDQCIFQDIADANLNSTRAGSDDGAT